MVDDFLGFFCSFYSHCFCFLSSHGGQNKYLAEHYFDYFSQWLLFRKQLVTHMRHMNFFSILRGSPILQCMPPKNLVFVLFFPFPALVLVELKILNCITLDNRLFLHCKTKMARGEYLGGLGGRDLKGVSEKEAEAFVEMKYMRGFFSHYQFCSHNG